MIDRKIAIQKTQKIKKKRVNQFIRFLNQEIKENIKKGYSFASCVARPILLQEEVEAIENYYKELNYSYHWDDIDFFTVEWYEEE